VRARTEQPPPIVVRNSYALPAPTSIPVAYSDPLPTTRILGEDYYPSPAVYQWSFGLQQRISASWAVNFYYIGSHTIHNSQWVQFNPGELPVGPLANLSLQERRRLKGWGCVVGWGVWGSGKYESGTLGIKNREWHGLSFMSNLTWAKNLTTSYS